MRQHRVVDLENEAAVRARHQFMLAAGGQIDHDARGGRGLPVHPDADVFHAVSAHADVALRRGHHGVGKVDDDACRRIERRHFGRERALRLELDPQSVLAVRDLEPLQCSARGHPLARHVSRGCDQNERQQRNQETQQLLSHFPISPCEAVSPPCVSSKSVCLQAYTAGVVIFFTTSRVKVLPNRSCSVSWKTMESPVIFTT